MTNILVILSLLLAVLGGTGFYMFYPLPLNIFLVVSVAVIIWLWCNKYYLLGVYSLEINFYKIFILLIYISFLITNVLIETISYSNYQFNAIEGILRDYTDFFRGLASFLIVAIIYSFVKNSKLLIIMPPLCLTVILIGQYLEVNQIISLHTELQDDNGFENQWTPTEEEMLVRRPNGFLNANMTAALALIWLFVAIESQTKSPGVIKGLTFLLALAVCLLTQSRAALLFLAVYALYKLIIHRNFKFLLFLSIFGVIGVSLAFYSSPDLVQEIIDNFASRADAKEASAMERLYLINLSIDNIIRSPFIGNGLYFLQKTTVYGLSSHNQILEILSNFGFLGLVVMTLVYITYYHINSFLYLSLCIFPTLLFSHNFFDTIGYQVALAFAYTVSKDNLLPEKENTVSNDAE